MSISPSSESATEGAGAADNKLPALWSVFKVLAGNGSYVLLGFLANVVSANGLSPTGFGQVSVCLAILNVLQEVCGNGVDMAMVRLAAPHVKDDPVRAQTFYSVALNIKLAINTTVAAVLWFLAPLIAGYSAQGDGMVVLLHWVSVGLVGASLYNYSLSRLQAEERFTLYAVLRTANNIAKLLILAAIALLNIFRPSTVIAAWMAAFFVGYVLWIFFEQRKLETAGPSRDSEYRGEIRSSLFHFSKWLVGSSFLFSLYSRIDMLLLSRFSTSAEVGNYAAAWNITYIIDLVTYSVIIALLPRATGLTTGAEFSAYLKRTFLICAGIALMLSPMYLLADIFFRLLFPEYGLSPDTFRILFTGALITLLFHPLYLILYTRNQVHRLTYINLILVFLSLGLGLIFIPEYGTIGAAWVTVAGRLLASGLIVFYVVKELKLTGTTPDADPR